MAKCPRRLTRGRRWLPSFLPLKPRCAFDFGPRFQPSSLKLFNRQGASSHHDCILSLRLSLACPGSLARTEAAERCDTNAYLESTFPRSPSVCGQRKDFELAKHRGFVACKFLPFPASRIFCDVLEGPPCYGDLNVRGFFSRNQCPPPLLNPESLESWRNAGLVSKIEILGLFQGFLKTRVFTRS